MNKITHLYIVNKVRPLFVVVGGGGTGADDENDKTLYVFFFAIARRSVYEIVAYPAPVPDKKACIVCEWVSAVLGFGVRSSYVHIFIE